MAKYNEPVVDTPTVNDKQVAFSNITVPTTTPNYSGMSGTQIAEQIRSTNTAKDQAAQAAASKPEISVAGQARGDQLQWNPKTQQYQIIKGVNVVQGPTSTGAGANVTGGNTGSGLTGAVTGATGPNPFLTTSASASAFNQFRAQFQAIGLGSLADSLLTLSLSPNAPTTSTEYYQALLQTPEYKARFGDTNAMRQKNGLPMLTEGEILKSEMNISDTLRNMGLPVGFYDQPSDFQKFIALDKSAAEVGDIVKAYQDVAKQTDPAITNALQTYYGIGLGGVTAALMDPTKAQPILEAITQKGTAAAAAASAGVTDIAGYSQVAQGMGAGTLDYAKQAQAFAQAQQLNQQVGTLSNIYGGAYGGSYNTAQGLQESLSGPEAVQAAKLRQALTTQELSSFGGSAGASQQGQSLGIGTQQGVQ